MDVADLPGANQEVASQQTTRLIACEEALDRSAHVLRIGPLRQTENPLGEVGSVDIGGAGEADAIGLDGRAVDALAGSLVGEEENHRATSGRGGVVAHGENESNLVLGHHTIRRID